MALLILEKPTTLYIPFARVNDDDLYPPTGTVTHTMGWGITNQDGQVLSDILRVVDMEIIDNNNCEDDGGDSHNGWIFPSMLCALTKGKDAWQGDSGGPLIVKDKNGRANQDVIVGVVSWGIAGVHFFLGYLGVCPWGIAGLKRQCVKNLKLVLTFHNVLA